MPFMDNLNNLRMNNIYGNPFNPPTYDPVDQQLKLYDQMRLRKLWDTPISPEEMAGATPLSMNRGMQDSAPAKPMNTVFSQPISPLDQAKLELQKQKLGTQEDIAEQNRQSRESIAQSQIGSRQTIAKGSQDIQNRKVDVSQVRAKIAADRTQGMNTVVQVDKTTGNSYLLNKTTGEKSPIGKTQMGQEEYADMLKNNEIELIDERGEQAQETTRARVQAEAETRPETMNRRVTAAQAVLDNNPDLKDVIHITSDSKGYMLKPPSAGGLFSSGITQEKYDKAKNLIEAELKKKPTVTTPSPTTKTTETPKTTTTTTGPTIPKGRVAIYKNGQYAGHVPENQKADAVKGGFTLSPGGE